MSTTTTTAEKSALRALRLVLALHRQPASANVPGFDVNLDPKAEEQVAAAVAALTFQEYDEEPPLEPFFDDPNYAAPEDLNPEERVERVEYAGPEGPRTGGAFGHW